MSTKTPITYSVSKSKDEGYAYELTVQREGKEKELRSRWPKEDQMRDAIGCGTIMAIQSKQDYGNMNVRLVIELEICSIIDPMIKI